MKAIKINRRLTEKELIDEAHLPEGYKFDSVEEIVKPVQRGYDRSPGVELLFVPEDALEEMIESPEPIFPPEPCDHDCGDDSE